MVARRLVPSVISLFRAILGIVIYFSAQYRVFVFALFVIAACSDAADGALARQFGVATSWGEYLDQAADFVLGVSGVLALLVTGWLGILWLWLIVPPLVIFGYIRLLVPARSPVQLRAGLFGAIYFVLILAFVAVGLASRAWGFHYWYLLVCACVIVIIGWLKQDRLRHWTSVW
jgi:phosphatidylglycerophosphate synthase